MDQNDGFILVFHFLTQLVGGMPRGLNVAVIARIEDILRAPTSMPNKLLVQQLALNFDVTERTIYKHQKRLRAGRQVGRPSGGPRRVITWRIE